MQLQKSIFQETLVGLPTQLDILRVINIRGSNVFAPQKNLYTSLSVGDMGEQTVMDYIAKYGDPSWVILRNIWLSHFGELECDLILITKHSIYVIEIKNYTGKFTYENGKCYYNQNETKINPIEQVRKNKVDLQNILSQIYPNIKIEAVVIFVGADNEVEILSEINDIKVINRTQIRNFILQIKNKEERTYQNPLNANKIIQQLHKFEIQNPFMHAPLTPGEMNEIRGGIYCANCYNFNVQLTRLNIKCDCGLTESKEEAVIRTICDLGVLNYEDDLYRKDIVNFLAGDVSLSYIRKVLNMHFTVINNFSHSYIQNTRLPYSHNYEQYAIKKPKIFQHPNGDLTLFKTY